MTDWNHVIVEGFCMAEADKPPCGKEVSAFCLGSAVGLCPYFSYTEAEGEREVARFVPLYLIIWDRITSFSEELWWDIRWYSWKKWTFKWTWKKYISFKEPTLEDRERADAIWASINMRRLNTKRRFRGWFPKAVALEKDGRS